MGKLARARVSVSQAIRIVPFYLSQWKQFANGFHPLAKLIARLDKHMPMASGLNLFKNGHPKPSAS